MISRLYLMPTQDCNCECTYCYIPKEEKGKKCNQDYLFAVVNEFMNKLEQSNIIEDPEIRFVGGEPYLDIDNVLKISNNFLNRFDNGNIIINSNGTLIKEDNLTKVICKERLIHIVSLDGIEKIHNKRRISKNNMNSFDQTARGIKLLKSMNFPVYINMVLDEYTMTGLNDFMVYIRNELDIHELSVSLLYNPANKLSNDVKYDLIKGTYKLAEKNGILIGGHHRVLLGAENPDFACKAGVKTLLISSDKKIYACQRFVGRIEGEYFNEISDIEKVGCEKCVEKECYTEDNIALGSRIYKLYKNGLSHYRSVNSFDKILFGVI